MEKDLYSIAQLVKEGNFQAIGDDETSFFLSLYLEDKEDEDTAREYISHLIEEGYTSGIDPNWEIEY